MPPKTKKKTKKSSKCKCSNHIQNTRVTVGGGGGGGAPIVYATYAPVPPQMQTSMPYETGRGFVPEKFERNPYNNHGVNASQGNYSSNAPQAHSDMSLLEKYFHDADAAKPQSEAGRSDHPMSEASKYSESSVNMSTSSFTNQASRSIPATQFVGGSQSIPARAKAPSTQGGNSKLQTPLQKAAGKRPMRPISESGSYISGHVSNSSGSINPNAIVPRASGQRSYGSVYEVPGEMPGKFARVNKEVFLEAQRQKDMRDYFNKQKPGFRVAKRRLQIGPSPGAIPDQVV